MDENTYSQNESAPNEDGPFIGKKSLKAMLEQSEDILRKNGGPTFLKRRDVIEVKTENNETELIKAQQIHALKELIHTIPGQLQRHEDKIQDLMQEVHLVLASMKAQQNTPQITPPTNSNRSKKSYWSTIFGTVFALALAITSFSLGKKWNNPAPSNSKQEAAQAIREFVIKPRTNLRIAPSLNANIITLAIQETKALAIQSQGEWIQVLVNQISGRENVVGWVHKSNLISTPTQL